MAPLKEKQDVIFKHIFFNDLINGKNDKGDI
jgi:hypothetical protein